MSQPSSPWPGLGTRVPGGLVDLSPLGGGVDLLHHGLDRARAAHASGASAGRLGQPGGIRMEAKAAGRGR
eukprot:1687284-Alexandrium_andersonii.AAC.1